MNDHRMVPSSILIKENIGSNKKKRNGFVNALLLSTITILFGGLCLTYMLIGIIGN